MQTERAITHWNIFLKKKGDRNSSSFQREKCTTLIMITIDGNNLGKKRHQGLDIIVGLKGRGNF